MGYIADVLGMSISIHASAKEATSMQPKDDIDKINFNPRLREGGDCNATFNDDNINISIHASAKEATGLFHTSKGYITISIHASAKEATG